MPSFRINPGENLPEKSSSENMNPQNQEIDEKVGRLSPTGGVAPQKVPVSDVPKGSMLENTLEAASAVRSVKVEKFMASIENSGDLVKRKPLTDADRKEIREQLANTLEYLESNRADLVAKAADDPEGFTYLTPQYQGFEKTGKFKEGGKYTGAHLQVCEDGTVYFTPKHEKLNIGKGTFKNVRLGLEEKSGKLVASASVRGEVEDVKRETEFIHKNHKHVAYTTYTHPGYSAPKGKLVMPYAQHGDVENFVGATEKSPFLKSVTNADVGRGMVQSVARQHSAGIINRDIKLENFLLAEDDGLQVWCLDRGLATMVDAQPDEAVAQGTLHYMAPEVLDMRSDILPLEADTKEKVDIYSLGVALYALQEGHTDEMFQEEEANMLPWFSYGQVFTISFKGKNASDAYTAGYEKYLAKNKDFAEKGTWNALIMDMVHPDPSKRPTIEEVESRFE